MDPKIFLTIVHLFGVVIGAGGAYMSDLLFFSATKDNKISQTEMRFLELGSRMIWLGLLILFLSGLGLFLIDPAKYLASAKFLVKITIVLVIFINGLVFHFFHLDRIRRHVGEYFTSSDQFMRWRPVLISSGAISFVSWTTAIILGTLPSIPFTYTAGLAIYLGLITLAIVVARLLFSSR